MSCRQAFHTSCRSGLSGHAGFQFNAASGGLGPEQLTRLAADHSGYRPPPDAPAEPDPEEIAALPVDLRYLPVEGVGLVVSRTVYVGREFRGGEGEPDSGRFGNYFSHIIAGEGADPFGGLLPIELWEAPHWSTAESARTELPVLERVEPGPVDLDQVLGRLLSRGVPALAAVSDAALSAVLGGPRMVIVEAEPELGAAWVAWASFTLPPDRAVALTFATFEGRPRVAESVRMCVTTPACDTDFPPYELGSAVTVVDVAAPPPVSDLSLYGRVLAALAGDGAEAVSAAIRDVPPGLDPARAAAELAVAARRLELVLPAELPQAIAALRGRLSTAGAGALAEMAAELPEGESVEGEAEEWAQLYAAARGSSEDPEATALVDVALERLLPALGPDAPALPEVDPAGPAPPSAAVLVKWLGLLSGAVGDERFGPYLTAGLQLGLVGCNTALDKELVEPIARSFADPAVQASYEAIGRSGNARVIEGVALKLAEAVGSGQGLELLRRAATQPLAREAVRANATEAGDFESIAAWELLRAGSAGADRGSGVAALAARAETRGHEAMIRGLYGTDGPVGADENAELLAAWDAAGREAPFLDYERALDCLGELSFRQGEEARRLFGVLRNGQRAPHGAAEYVAWGLLFEAAPERQAFRDWAEAADRLLQGGESLSPAREGELSDLAARVAIQCLGEDDHARGIEILLRGMGRDWPLELGDALARRIAKSLDPPKLVAQAFVLWQAPKNCREQLLEVALPRATRDLPPARLDEVGEILGERRGRAWQRWLEEHPPRRAVSRAVRGVFRRGEES